MSHAERNPPGGAEPARKPGAQGPVEGGKVSAPSGPRETTAEQLHPEGRSEGLQEGGHRENRPA
jgi:hypothetical protein